MRPGGIKLPPHHSPHLWRFPMEEYTLLILDHGLSPAEIAATGACCKTGPIATATEEN